MLRAGITEIEIARILGVTRQAVNNEMRGIKASSRVRDLICKLTKTPEHKLFPEHHKESPFGSTITTGNIKIQQ